MVTSSAFFPERSDHDLAFDVTTFLAACNVPSFRSLRVEARAGQVTIRGIVRSFYEKQLVQSVARRVAGVGQLVDVVSVAQPVRVDLASRRFTLSPDLRQYFAERQRISGTLD